MNVRDPARREPYTLSLDRDLVVVVELRGLWDDDIIRNYIADVTPLLARSRAHHGHALSILDARTGTVQRPDIISAMDREATRLYRRDDKVATLLASSLLKMQFKRLNEGTRPAIFADEGAARVWLLEGSRAGAR